MPTAIPAMVILRIRTCVTLTTGFKPKLSLDQ